MKSAPFRLHEPISIDEAAGLLDELGGDAKALAGGQSLVPMLAMRLARFEHLIDLNRIDDLSKLSRHGDVARVGAMARHHEIEHSIDLGEQVPLLARATRFVGHSAIRSRGTLGGSLAHADPAAEQPAVVLALDATLEVRSTTGIRRVPAAEFFVGTWSTALDSHELLTAIEIPIWGSRSGFAIEELTRRAGDFAVAGAVAAVELGPGSAAEIDVLRCAVAVFGVAMVPIRAAATEAAIEAGETPSEASALSLDGVDVVGDIHASSTYRRSVVPILVERALRRAIDEAEGRAR